MNEELERRIEKLPQWVQRYISKLRRNNAALRAERGKIAEGDAKITFSVDFDETHGLPDQATVKFQLSEGYLECSLETTLDGDEVRVRTCPHRLVIRPAASNAVNLSMRR